MSDLITRAIAKSLFKNGMERGTKNLRNIIRRIYYYSRHAVEMTIKYKQSYPAHINYNGQNYDVTVKEDVDILNQLRDGSSVSIRWIPGKKNAMLSQYVDDKRVQKTVFICDIVSVLSLVLFISSLALSFKNESNLPECGILVSVVIMIISSQIKKRLRVKFENSNA